MPASDETLKVYTLDEVAAHNTKEDCWLVIGNETNGGPKVYDVSAYMDSHPGGHDVIEDVAGENADEAFEDMGHSPNAREIMKKYLIGELHLTEEEKKAMAEKAAAAKAKQGNMGMILLVVLVAVAVGVYTQVIAKEA